MCVFDAISWSHSVEAFNMLILLQSIVYSSCFLHRFDFAASKERKLAITTKASNAFLFVWNFDLDIYIYSGICYSNLIGYISLVNIRSTLCGCRQFEFRLQSIQSIYIFGSHTKRPFTNKHALHCWYMQISHTVSK